MKCRDWKLVLCAMVLLCLAIVCYLGVLGGGSQMFRTAGKALNLGAILCTLMASFDMLYASVKRPWRSGSAEYQKAKRDAYKALKENPEKATAIQQAFYLKAEECNVSRDTAVKDWYLIAGEANHE